MSRPGRDVTTGLLLAAGCALLVPGLTLPVITVAPFWVFETDKSILGVAWTLIDGGNAPLGIAILIFSVVFPAAKLALSIAFWAARDTPGGARRRALRWAVRLGKWSMMDVFLTALIVALLSLDLVWRVSVGIGVYFFCAAIVAGMLAALRLERRAGP